MIIKFKFGLQNKRLWKMCLGLNMFEPTVCLCGSRLKCTKQIKIQSHAQLLDSELPLPSSQSCQFYLYVPISPRLTNPAVPHASTDTIITGTSWHKLVFPDLGNEQFVFWHFLKLRQGNGSNGKAWKCPETPFRQLSAAFQEQQCHNCIHHCLHQV